MDLGQPDTIIRIIYHFLFYFFEILVMFSGSKILKFNDSKINLYMNHSPNDEFTLILIVMLLRYLLWLLDSISCYEEHYDGNGSNTSILQPSMRIQVILTKYTYKFKAEKNQAQLLAMLL